MMDNCELVLTVAALIAASVSGGAFFTFSNFVMPALAKRPAAEAVSAMQAINAAAPNPMFVTAIAGAGLIGVPVALANVDHLAETSSTFLFAGLVLSLASLAVTMLANVPKNNALDQVDPTGATAEADWAVYVGSWTRANSLRTVTSLASVGCYALSLEAW